MRLKFVYRAAVSAVASCALIASCGDPSQLAPTQQPNLNQESLVAPSLRLLSPAIWSAGQRVLVVGEDFVDPSQGQIELNFEGVFVTQAGESSPISMRVPAIFSSPGRVEFNFEADLAPAGFGYALGEFRGEVTASNIREGARKTSNSIPSQVQIGPSLVVWQVVPDSRNCAEDRVTKTIDGEDMSIRVEAVGMYPSARDTPLQFRWRYRKLSGELVDDSRTVRNGTQTYLYSLDFGDLPDGGIDDVTAPEEGLPLGWDFGLQNEEELADGSIPLGAKTLVNLEVEDAAGLILQRTVALDFRRANTIRYDGNVRVAELYEPVHVSSCLPGGEYGRSVSYSGGQSESRSRSVGFSVSLDVGADISVVSVSAGFGMDVDETLSSSESESLSLSGEILPNQFGVFYRQTQRLEREGLIIERDACGVERAIGDAIVTDWNWAPDLAVTQDGQCPPLPPSNLPNAQLLPE